MKISSGRHVGQRVRKSRIPHLPHLFHRVPVAAPERPALAPLDAEHMAQRPYDAVVVPVDGGQIAYYPAPAARSYRVDDVVEVTDQVSLHCGELGVIVEISGGTVLPLMTQLASGGVVFFDAIQLELIAPAPVADTLVFDAVPVDAAELDELPLMGGAR